ncbi:protein ALP1-like [Euphorbia lathyris]|uniref:protein ALP1-like n=1 Tax=Euphorbia lathyris TaxID=212925 RepID=UPI0033133D6B
MVPIREFKRRKKAEKKVDQNVLTAALSSLQPQPNQPLDWWDDFSTRITGPLSNSKKSKTFESVFKISRKTFDYICSLVHDTLRSRQSNLTGSNGKPLLPADEVAIALRRLSSGDSFSNVGDLFGINRSTVSHITWRFVEAMEERGLHHLCWPSTEAEMEDIKHKFEKNHGLPNCCGVIDTTHIVMTLSTVDDSNDAWIDQEKNHSMALQAIVGPDMRFLDVSIGYPGSLSDALVLQYSDFFKLSEERKRLNGKKIEVKKGTELREYIIGDEGFPLLPWLLTPFQPALHDYQVEFNKRHSATLTVAQIALAKLKEIWRIIHGTMFMPDKNKLPRIVLICCLLHNIVIEMEDKVLDETCISHAHDKDYQQQTCESASQTGTDLREEVSLGLSGVLVKNPQSRAQYKVQPVPPLTSQLLLPGKPKVDWFPPSSEELVKPDLGEYWLAKHGDRVAVQSEAIMNDLDETFGWLYTVQKNRTKYSGASHAKMGKRKLLVAYTHICALEADVIQGVADKATIKSLETEVSIANSNIAAAAALSESKDAKIKELEDKLVAVTKDLEAAKVELKNMDTLCGSRAFYYGERIMAYIKISHPELGFVDPELLVPSAKEAKKYDKMENARDFIYGQVLTEMKKNVGEDVKPFINLEEEEADHPSEISGERSG